MPCAPSQPCLRVVTMLVAAAGIGLVATGVRAQCTFTCPGGAASEPEACGVRLNDGCNLAVPAFSQISCGTTVCGTVQAQNGDRDTDWYTVSVTDPDGDGVAQISATVTSEFPSVFFILNDDCANLQAFSIGETENCQPGTISACVLAPGTYRVFVSTGSADGSITDGIPCGSGNRYSLTVSCTDLCVPPPNDVCTGATTVTDGSSFVITNDAITNGPAHALCDPGNGDDQIHNDVWFTYTASCTGDLIVETCNLVNFNSRIAVYDGCACPATEARLLACNDDMMGCDTGTSALFAPVVAGQCYLIRVGGFNDAFGLGTMRLQCYAGGLCPDTGDCNTEHPTPGCDDAACCETVCAADQFCCLVEWDALCVQQAEQLCTAAPMEACCIAEGACVNVSPPDCIGLGGSPQGVGTVCGGALTCLPESCCLPDDSCQNVTRDECTALGGTSQGPGTNCTSAPCLIPCPSDIAPAGAIDSIVNVQDLLHVLATWGPCPPPCSADVVPDGDVNVTDLLQVLGDWGPCP